MSRFWYYFINGDESFPSSYGRIVGDPNPESLCGTGQTVCAVYAVPNGLNPGVPTAISTNLTNYFIGSRAAGGAPYPINDSVVYFDKPFVYMKS